MAGNNFNQVRVSELVDIEIDIDDNGIDEAIMRFLVRSRNADQLAVEFPYSMWLQIQETLNAALTRFPGGRHSQ
jgi:hypothetical protein